MKKKDPDVKEIPGIEKEKIRSVRKKMKSDSFFHPLAEKISELRDPTREKIIYR